MHLSTSLSFLFLVPTIVHALDSSQQSAHLQAAHQLLGDFETSTDSTASWMSSMQDSLPIQGMSIPGTHDSLTWNISGIAASFTKTQDMPLFKQLDAGVRFIDLRVGENNGQVMLYHSTVLLDQTAQLNDIFWGLYTWLDAHPSETIIVSVKVDEGNSTQALQQSIYDDVTGSDTAAYWFQNASLPTLGEARHKAILLRRFAFDQITVTTPIGIEASSGWSDNNASFTIAYDTSDPNAVLNIEDLYDVTGPDLASAVSQKLTAVTTNLDLATGSTLSNQQFISFASGYSGLTVNPQSFAEGNTTTTGVNEGVLQYLASHRGSRFGVVLFDFIGSDNRLVAATLSQEVDLSATPSGAAAATQTGSGETSHSLGGAVGGVKASFGAVVGMLGVSVLAALVF